MEQDAKNLLKFMASNGLVTNASKTALLYLNLKKQTDESATDIKIGDSTISRQKHAKLLGMTFQDNLKWHEHIHGKGGVISSLNQRLYLLKRLSNSVNKKANFMLFNIKFQYYFVS